MGLNGKDFATSLVINGAVCLSCVVIFSFLRVNKYSARFYSPKRFNTDVVKKPRRLPLGLFGWVMPVFSYPEEEVMATAGLDTVIFIRMLKLGLKTFVYITLWVCVVLIPVNYTGRVVDTQPELNLSDLDRITLSNLGQGDPKMWAHLITVYVVSYMLLKLVWEANQGVSQLRVKFLNQVPKGGPTHTVLVTDVPGLKHGTVLDRVKNGFLYRLLPQSLKQKLDDVLAATYQATYGNLKQGLNFMGNKMRASNDVESHQEAARLLLDPWHDATGKFAQGARAQQVVEQEMDAVYGADNVASVHVVHDQSVIAPLVAQYDAVKSQLEDLVDDYLSRKKRGKELKRKEVRVIGPMLGKWGIDKYGMKPVKVDALQHHSDLLAHLKQQIDEAAREAQGVDLPAAFVTFNNRYTQAVASTTLQSHDETCWRVESAPGSDEVVWDNLGMRFWERNVREMLMWVLLVAIIVCYLPVTLSLQAIIQIEKLDKTPVIKDIAAIPVIREIIKAIIPGLVLKVFLALLPMLLAFMMRTAGRPSLSSIDLGVVTKFFVFQFFAVFVFTFIGGAVLNQLDTIVDKVSDIANNPIGELTTILGVAAPQQATFFLTYVLLSVGAKSVQFLRVVGLVLFWVFSKLAATQRAKRRLWADQSMTFGAYTTDHTMVILFGLVFCCVMPLIAPVCMLYFAIVLVLEKYNLVYVFKHPYEAAGRMWPAVFTQVMTAVYFFQLMMLFLLSIKQFAFSVLIVPACIITGIFHWSCNQLFRRAWCVQALRAAADMDRLDEQARIEAAAAAAAPAPAAAADEVPWADGDKATKVAGEVDVARLYLSPVFKVEGGELAALLAEAQRVGRLVAGEAVDVDVLGGGDGEDTRDQEPLSPRSTGEESPRGEPLIGSV